MNEHRGRFPTLGMSGTMGALFLIPVLRDWGDGVTVSVNVKRASRSLSRWFPNAFALLLLIAPLVEADPAPPHPSPVEKTTERGPVKATIRLEKPSLVVAEKSNLTLRVQAEDGVEIELPEAPESENVRILTKLDAPPVIRDGFKEWTRTYQLDSLKVGEHTFPGLTVRFSDLRSATKTDDGADSGMIEGELTTEPLTLTVRTVLEEGADPTQFRDVKGLAKISLPIGWRGMAWMAAAIVAAGIMTFFLRRWLKRVRSRSSRVYVPPPHEWALDQLRQLMDERLVESGRIEEFYVRLSGIVRVYVELRFGLMAPERTTEEFLIEAQRSDRLSTEQKSGLGDFLQACDMVKFARYRPDTGEVEQSTHSARDFIRQTIPDTASVQLSEAAA